LIRRFSNRTLEDTVERINTDASINLLLDPIRDRLAAGQPIASLALAVAAWIRRLALVGDDVVAIRHPLSDELKSRARAGCPDPTPVLAMTEVFGDLSHNAEFILAVTNASRALEEFIVRRASARPVVPGV